MDFPLLFILAIILPRARFATSRFEANRLTMLGREMVTSFILLPLTVLFRPFLMVSASGSSGMVQRFNNDTGYYHSGGFLKGIFHYAIISIVQAVL